MDGHGGSKTADQFAGPRKEEIHDDAPDPDEGDLDDLDDILDEFSSAKLIKPQPSQARSTKTCPPEDTIDIDASDVDANLFAKELQNQMAAFMGSMDETPDIKQELKNMMKEIGTAAAGQGTGPDTHDTPGISAKPLSGDEPFKETIRKTMERMQASGEQAGAAAQTDTSDDLMAQMLKDLHGGGLPGEGDEEGFNKMLLSMMEQLTNKDILYDPMKELHNKFPPWMEKNRAKTKAEDFKRYEEQQQLVGEIIGRFEEKGYSDSKAEDREFIVDRMQRMQAMGSPPADLVGEMDAAIALSDMDNPCPQQ